MWIKYACELVLFKCFFFCYFIHGRRICYFVRAMAGGNGLGAFFCPTVLRTHTQKHSTGCSQNRTCQIELRKRVETSSKKTLCTRIDIRWWDLGNFGWTQAQYKINAAFWKMFSPLARPVLVNCFDAPFYRTISHANRL